MECLESKWIESIKCYPEIFVDKVNVLHYISFKILGDWYYLLLTFSLFVTFPNKLLSIKQEYISNLIELINGLYHTLVLNASYKSVCY